MVYFRLFLILYVFPLMFIESIFCLFGKKDFILHIWIWFTIVFAIILCLVKLVFALAGVVE